MGKKFTAHLAVFMANLIYAANYIIAKEVVPDYVEPYGMIVVRVSVSTLLFWALSIFMFNEKIQKTRDYWHLALCAFFGVALNQLMFFKGLSMTNPINPAIIMTSTPILVLLISMIYLKENVSTQKLIGLGFGLTGALSLILIGDNFEMGSDTLQGDILIFINAMSYGLYLVLVKPLMNRYNPMTIIKWIFTFGNIFVIPVGINELIATDWSALSTMIWFCFAYVVVFTTFLAYGFNAFGLKRLSPMIIGFYIYLQPVLASMIAIAVGKDELTFNKIVFALLIFVGVYLVSGPSIKLKSK